MGNIVGFQPPGGLRQPRQGSQLLQGLAGALGIGGDALHLLPGVAAGHAQQLRPLPPLGHPQGHPVAAAARQQGGEGVHILRLTGHQDLPGQGLTAQIILAQHGGEDIRLLLVGGGGEHLHLPAQKIAVLNVQHGAAAADLARVHAPHIRVGADPGNNLLGLAQHRNGPDPVPQGGGLFKVQLLRRLFHLLAQLRRQLAVVAAEDPHRLADAGLILRLTGAVRAAEAVAAANVVIQAGPLPADIPGKLAGADGQAQGAAHRLDGQAGLTPSAEGTEVFRAVVSGLSHQGEAGIGRVSVQPHKGIALVVLQQDVVPGHVALDERVLQDQGLELRGHENGIEMIHLGHHGPGLFIVGGSILEILADAVFQLFGLAHINHLAGFVHHQIDPRGKGQIVGLLPQLVLGHSGAPFRVFPSIPRFVPER